MTRHLLLSLTLGAITLAAAPARAQDSTRVADSTATVAPIPAPVPAPAPAPTQRLGEMVMADTTFSILVQALTQTGLMQGLQNLAGDKFTLFAPTNAAFRALVNYPAIMEPANGRPLYDLLMYHLVPGEYLAIHLPQVATLRSWQGTEIPVVTADSVSTVGGARVLTADRAATNGVLHSIDAVMPMAPPAAAPAGQ